VDETISVEVGEDHLAAFRRSPKVAIAELIWNGLDADATEVSVEYELNAFDGVDAVVVRDNGTGMTPTDAAFGFPEFRQLVETDGHSDPRRAGHARQARPRLPRVRVAPGTRLPATASSPVRFLGFGAFVTARPGA
jgi:hypothetical protein